MAVTVHHVIGGREVKGDGAPLSKADPSTGVLLVTFNAASEANVADAVAAARQAFADGGWAGDWRHRQAVLRSAGAAIREGVERLADLQVAETGLTRQSALRQIEGGARWFEYYADFLSLTGGASHDQIDGATTITVREPVGVVALFTPWNVPVTLASIKLAPALAAGNSVVWKPSEEVPGTSRALFDLLREAGVQDAVLNLVNGPGATTGADLAAGDVDAISFTGGGAGGAAVARAASARAVPVTLELGGKSATIVFADADMDVAVASAVTAAYGNNGEACLAGSRVLVEARAAEAFLAAFTARTAALKVGPAAEAGTDIGPMISKAHAARVAAYFDSARADGDRCIFGGDPVPAGSAFVRPSAYEVASPQSRLWREEVFGPAAAIARFAGEAEAVRLANDSVYGLTAYVFTADCGRALRVARAVRAGTVLVNTAMLRELNAPFGGFGLSGMGREGGRYSFENLTEAKTITIRHGRGAA